MGSINLPVTGSADAESEVVSIYSGLPGSSVLYTSGTYTTMTNTGLTGLSATVEGGSYLLLAQVTDFADTISGRSQYRFRFDAGQASEVIVEDDAFQHRLDTAFIHETSTFTAEVELNAGTYTFDIQARVATGSLQFRVDSNDAWDIKLVKIGNGSITPSGRPGIATREGTIGSDFVISSVFPTMQDSGFEIDIITDANEKVELSLTGSVVNTSLVDEGGYVFAYQIDGGSDIHISAGQVRLNSTEDISFSVVTDALTAGSHTIKLRTAYFGSSTSVTISSAIGGDSVRFQCSQFGSGVAPANLPLNSITDVDAPSPSDGDTLTWVAANNAWEPVAPSGGGGLSVYLLAQQSGTTVLNQGDDMVMTTQRANAGSFVANGDGWDVPSDGTYMIDAAVTVTANSAGQRMLFNFIKNGSTVVPGITTDCDVDSNDFGHANPSAIVDLVAGDTITLRATNLDSSTATPKSGRSWLRIIKLG